MGKINEKDVLNIANEIIASVSLAKERDKVIANILWHFIYPEKYLWKVSKYSSINRTVNKNDVDKIAKAIVQSRTLPQEIEQVIATILWYLISLEEKDLKGN